MDDDDRFVSYWCDGHVEHPTLADYRAVGRAFVHDAGDGYVGTGGLAALLRTARWSTGYVGQVPGIYDLVPCEADGETDRYDDDDNQLVATKVRPTTWVAFDLGPTR